MSAALDPRFLWRPAPSREAVREIQCAAPEALGLVLDDEEARGCATRLMRAHCMGRYLIPAYGLREPRIRADSPPYRLETEAGFDEPTGVQADIGREEPRPAPLILDDGCWPTAPSERHVRDYEKIALDELGIDLSYEEAWTQAAEVLRVHHAAGHGVSVSVHPGESERARAARAKAAEILRAFYLSQFSFLIGYVAAPCAGTQI